MIFGMHGFKSHSIALIKFSGIEQKVVNIFHFFFIDLLLSLLVCSFSKLINCQWRHNICSKIYVTTFLKFFKVPYDRLINFLNSVHHDDHSNIIRIKAFISYQVSNILCDSCQCTLEHRFCLAVHTDANTELNSFFFLEKGK